MDKITYNTVSTEALLKVAILHMPETVPPPTKPDVEPKPAEPRPAPQPSPFRPDWPKDRPLPQPKGRLPAKKFLWVEGV